MHRPVRSKLFRVSAVALAATAGTLALPGTNGGPGWFIPPAHADSDATVINDIKLDLGIGNLVIKYLEVKGSTIPAAELKALLTGTYTGDAIALLAKFSAKSITVPEIAFEQKFGPVDQNIVYRDFVATDIVNGKIGSIDGGAASVSSDANGVKVTGKTGAQHGKGIDLAAIVRVLTKSAKGPDEPLVALYDSFGIDSYDISSPGVMDIHLGPITGGPFKGRPMKVPFVEILKKLPKTPTDGKEPSPEDTKEMLAFASSMFDAYNAFSFGKSEATDIRMKISAPGAENVSFSMARVSMSDFANARLGEMSFEGIDVASPQGTFKLGGFALRGLDYGKFMKDMASLMEKGGDGAPPTPEQMMNINYPTFDEFSVDKLDMDLLLPPSGENAGGPPVRTKMALGKFSVQPRRWLHFIPIDIAAVVDHFVMDVPADNPQFAPIAAFGLKSLDLSSAFDMGWDEAAKRLTLKNLSFNGAQLGSFSLKAVLDNVPVEFFSLDQEVRQSALFGAIIKSFDVNVDNQGLFEKVIAQQAAQQGRPADDIKKELVGGATGMIPMFLGTDPQAIELSGQIAKFLANPKKLHVHAESVDGLGMADMAAPDQILKKTKLDVKVGE